MALGRSVALCALMQTSIAAIDIVLNLPPLGTRDDPITGVVVGTDGLAPGDFKV